MTSSSVAKDLSWFGADYRPISSALTSHMASDSGGAVVIGIGTVNLCVKTKPDAKHRGHSTLTLRNVLHVPSAVCNIVGAPVLANYQVHLAPSPEAEGKISLPDGSPVGYFAPGRTLYELRLSGSPVGPRVGRSPLRPHVAYVGNAHWPGTEREKWVRASASDDPAQTTRRPPWPRSEEEKKWLKRRFDGEFHFLRCYGLNIYKDEHREIGWQIMRRMMSHEEAERSGA